MQEMSRDSASVTKQQSRAMLAKVHNSPLPLTIHQLPAFFPHNPISIIQFTYAILSSFILSVSSHPKRLLTAYFCDDTRSIHVTDSSSIQILWSSGFFGKGSLSRSEPTWLQREQQRLGFSTVDASEIITRRRRENRREFKRDRAKKERESIEEREKIDQDHASEPVKPIKSSHLAIHNRESRDSTAHTYQGIRHDKKILKEQTSSNESDGTRTVSNLNMSEMAEESHDKKSTPVGEPKEEKLEATQEYLQLTLQEGFFLLYGLGILSVCCPLSGIRLSAEELLLRCCSRFTDVKPVLQALEPDDPFLLNYVVYHHFRSLGWVVRSGLKFSVDYLLYNRGPPFAHAEFAINIVRNQWHPSWSSVDLKIKETMNQPARAWHWLHCINRVQSQVLKSLVFVYVDIPPPLTAQEPFSNVTEFFERYKIKEFIWRRWVPNRNRD